ncbi:hypothetical protein HNQ63_001413 [Wenzhouxiangella marina]|nr:hypothetical protein [Wenzhouxiangella marina]
MVAVYELPGSRHGRAFCKACGSPLPTSQDGGSLLVVPAGSLETDLAMRPQGHLFMASRASWDDRLDEVPRFDALPD